MSVIESEEFAYRARYAWFGRTGGLFAVSLIMTLGSLTLYRQPVHMVLGLLLFGAGTAMSGYQLLVAPSPLAADHRGITIDRRPVIDWRDIERISFGLNEAGRAVAIVIHQRREGAIEVDDDLEDVYETPYRWTELSFVSMEGWRLKQGRFLAVVARYALGVPIDRIPVAELHKPGRPLPLFP